MDMWSSVRTAVNRRSFIANGLTAAGVGILANGSSVFADDDHDERGGRLTRGDAALLRFAAAAEILETDFWVQYNELGGIQDREEPSGSGNPAYTAALAVMDDDMAQYIHDNTDDLNSPTKTSSMRTWNRRGKSQSISNGFALCLAVRRQVPAESCG